MKDDFVEHGMCRLGERCPVEEVGDVLEHAINAVLGGCVNAEPQYNITQFYAAGNVQYSNCVTYFSNYGK